MLSAQEIRLLQTGEWIGLEYPSKEQNEPEQSSRDNQSNLELVSDRRNRSRSGGSPLRREMAGIGGGIGWIRGFKARVLGAGGGQGAGLGFGVGDGIPGARRRSALCLPRAHLLLPVGI